MEYDFERFLFDSGEECNSKAEFIARIEREMHSVANVERGIDYIERQLYIRRLLGAKFCAERGFPQDTDLYNSQIFDLLDRLR